MNRISTLFFVVIATAIAADQGRGQGPYGPAPAYGPPAYGQPAYQGSPYGPAGYGGAPGGYAPEQGYPPQAAYAPQGYAPQGYAPQGYAPQGYAPAGMHQPMPASAPGYHPGSTYTATAYAMQPPVPAMEQPGAMMPPGAMPLESMPPGPAPGYAPQYAPSAGYPGGSYGEPIYGDPMFMNDYCSSCGANCGACECAAFGNGGCAPLWVYNPLRQVFGSLEILSWHRHGTNLPTLVTTSAAGTIRDNAGVLGEATTRSLLGDERVDDEMGGVRFTIGTWFDPQKEYGLVYRLTAPGDDEFNFSVNSNANGVPTIARPFFDTTINDQNAYLIAFNDPVEGVLATGGVSVAVTNEVVNHDLYAMLLISRGSGWRTDLIFGYQNTNIDESIQIRSFTTVENALFAPGFAVGSTIDVLDVLSVENEFHGGTVGLISELQHGPWSLRFLGKLAVGGTTSTASISGRTITTAPTDPPTVNQTEGGLLAQSTNIGTFEAESTTISPEATLTLGYCCTQNLRLTAGYSFMYWTHIVPSGALIDSTVNSSQIGGGALVGDPRPTPIIAGDSDFWVMGLNLGAEYRY